ncbi:MAG: response regulator [Candidatus Latescibacteria bacterium]|jgi:two-component system C4-dicarboxylate transport response regulator DctD|nr:response regulator [Candidatus Latescibacterota bacterium]
MATIVVMEDDAIVRNLVARVLEMQGHTVEAFPDAQPALDSVDFENVDLVITDLRMPTPGDEAIQAIRTLGYEVPVVVMSGTLYSGVLRKLRSIGIQEVIEKPFKIQHLIDVVDSLV